MAGATGQPTALAWHRVCGVDEIPPRGARSVEIRGRPIAVFRSSDDSIFALLDRCPHRGGPLSQGIVHGHCVTCPLHDWVIELATGEARAPDAGSVERFPVRIEGGVVMLGIASETAPQASADGTTCTARAAASATSAAPASESARLAAAR